ncbi:MAG: YjbQ family protein [Bacteroidota bacterium]|nr:MAG: YjbQ family protein [Bacteroidota bacterium]
MVRQQELVLKGYSRGFHLITPLIEQELESQPETGLLNILLKHTSAGICLNENADPSVRADFRSFFDRLVPENQGYITHTLEGSDDMPAHLKSALVGASLSIPITKGRLNLGTWQGIYFCEFRNSGGPRNLVLTIIH